MILIEVAIIGLPGAWSSEILKESLEKFINRVREVNPKIKLALIEKAYTFSSS